MIKLLDYEIKTGEIYKTPIGHLEFSKEGNIWFVFNECDFYGSYYNKAEMIKDINLKIKKRINETKDVIKFMKNYKRGYY